LANPLTIRGFGAQQWLDGLPVNYDTGDRDSFANVERIEVLKGPNAILYGGGTGAPTSGAVNVISKLPTDKASIETGLTFGTNNYLRPYFDVNQPLTDDKTVLFRVTGEYTASDSFVDVVHQDRYSFNPTLTFTDKSDTTLTIQGRISRFEQQGYEGLPAVGTVAGNFRLNPDLFIGPTNIPKSVTEVQGVTVTFDRQFDQYWSFNVKTRWSKSNEDQKSQTTLSAAPDVGADHVESRQYRPRAETGGVHDQPQCAGQVSLWTDAERLAHRRRLQPRDGQRLHARRPGRRAGRPAE
jgi:iron complex outermembrane receptor protein